MLLGHNVIGVGFGEKMLSENLGMKYLKSTTTDSAQTHR